MALADKGKRVTMIEESDQIGNDVEIHTMIQFNARVERGLIEVLTSTRVDSITEQGIATIDEESKKTMIEVDTVIVAKDLEPTTSDLAKKLEGKVKEVYTIGDAVSFRRIMPAVTEGFDTAMQL